MPEIIATILQATYTQWQPKEKLWPRDNKSKAIINTYNILYKNTGLLPSYCYTLYASRSIQIPKSTTASRFPFTSPKTDIVSQQRTRQGCCLFNSAVFLGEKRACQTNAQHHLLPRPYFYRHYRLAAGTLDAAPFSRNRQTFPNNGLANHRV